MRYLHPENRCPLSQSSSVHTGKLAGRQVVIMGALRYLGRKMRKPQPDRLLLFGSTLASLGATLAVGYWIYGLQALPHVSFWRLPGYVSVGLILLGLVALVIGPMDKDPPERIRQTQRGGNHSINVQSARDVFANNREIK